MTSETYGIQISMSINKVLYQFPIYCCDKVSQIQWFKRTQIYSLTVLEVGVRNQYYWDNIKVLVGPARGLLAFSASRGAFLTFRILRPLPPFSQPTAQHLQICFCCHIACFSERQSSIIRNSQKWKEFKFPSTWWINQMWSIHKIEYYSAMKRCKLQERAKYYYLQHG